VSNSIEILKQHLEEWSLLYGRRIDSQAMAVWIKLFANTPVHILTAALTKVVAESERMPPPGMLTKAIQIIYEQHPEWVPQHKIKYRTGEDARGVECVFWSDEPDTPAYRALDCPEGRAFIALLREWRTPDGLAANRGPRPYGTTTCQDCGQNYRTDEFFKHVCPDAQLGQKRIDERRHRA
jgi:hypothetical protein